MIADLKSYPEYKESGLPWLGRVPGHWGPLPVKGEAMSWPTDDVGATGTMIADADLRAANMMIVNDDVGATGRSPLRRRG